MKIRRGRSRVRTIISCAVALICAIGICYSGYKIIEWKLDSDKTVAQTNIINDVTDINEVDDSEDTETIDNNEPPESIYWKYIRMKLLDIDFTELRNINSDTIGWIQVSGTNINYPFVKTGNNDYYLTHSFDRTYSRAGWAFADFRNHADGTDKNFIIYAHGRYDGTMFGTLRNILTSGWLNNPDNFTVRTVNDGESALWQVFSVYKIPTTSDYIQTAFSSDAEFGRFAEQLRARSQHNFNTTVSGTDNILTLSTCYSSTERVVLHAKLIKRLSFGNTSSESSDTTKETKDSSTQKTTNSSAAQQTTADDQITAPSVPKAEVSKPVEDTPKAETPAEEPAPESADDSAAKEEPESSED